MMVLDVKVSACMLRAMPCPQTLVFSATLTLPAKLRARLRRGGGGSGGGASLESLMDKVGASVAVGPSASGHYMWACDKMV